MSRTTRPRKGRPKNSTPALFLFAAAALTACGKPTEAAPPGERLLVSGACLEAATGEVLAGVVVRGPGGAVAKSDDPGRFVLRGLRVGDSGWLRAESEGGLVAELPLSALEAGTLEVVFHLREAGE